MADRPSTAPTRVRQAANELDQLADHLELGDLVPLLARTEEALGTLRDAVEHLKRAARAEMNAAHIAAFRDPESKLPTLLASTTGTTTRTDGERLASVIAARVADESIDPRTGEVLPIGVICERVALAVAEAGGLLAPSAKWRKTPLKNRGLRPGDYIDEFGGRETVRWEQ